MKAKIWTVFQICINVPLTFLGCRGFNILIQKGISDKLEQIYQFSLKSKQQKSVQPP